MTELEKAARMALEALDSLLDVAMVPMTCEGLCSAESVDKWHDFSFRRDALRSALTQALATTEPIPMVLHCPKCGMQHIDEAEDERTEQICHGPEVVDEVIVGWDNPPHRSHLCHGCGTIWRPADVPTTGVAAITTKGKADTWEPGKITTTEPKLHSPEWFVEKRRAAVDRIASMPEAMQQNMHYAAATLPTTTERKGPLSKDRIREVFLSHGFTIKEGQTDLKPYVYDAAYALIALVQPATERKGEPVATVRTIRGVTIGYLETRLPDGTSLYTSPQVPEVLPWKGLDLNSMADAFEQVIEAAAHRENPFFNPITKNAQLALREFKLCIPAMQAIDAARKGEKS